MKTAKPKLPPTVSDLGSEVDHVNVLVGGQFFELFSSNLYSSPNKAFEELVTNSWDAGATTVYVRVPTDLTPPDATIWILDNGESMDAGGLKQLWHIGDSDKPTKKALRDQIGKFGIGKLSTYLLAERLTYICKANDGTIRTVEMDYVRIDKGQAANNLVSPGGIKLPLRELSSENLQTLLGRVPNGDEIRKLIDDGVPRQDMPRDGYADEFGQPSSEEPPKSDTWTLVLMTDLKAPGRDLQRGWIKWLLRTSLPLGDTMSIVFDGSVVESSKIDFPVERDFIIGPDLAITELYAPLSGDEDRTVKVESGTDPVPHIRIDGVPGIITGTVTLYAKRITGKSDEVGRSNGFFINILGRVVNAGRDGYFGLENLNHTVWAQFRACVRADGLNAAIKVNRETLSANTELITFRSFLRELFNRCRRIADNPQGREWPTIGEELAQSWGAIPLRAFSRALHRYERDSGKLPPTIRTNGIENLADELERFDVDMRTNPEALIRTVIFDSLGAEAPLYSYELAKRCIVVNADHPFVIENGHSSASHGVLRSDAVAQILSDAYLTDIGVYEDQIAEYQTHRDSLYRIIARITRSNGVTIARQLAQATDDEKALEHLALEALDYLGFTVDPQGQTGKPEGVITSPVKESKADPKRPYTFTVDAKSSKHDSIKTKDANVAALDDHRRTAKADYTLVVAPGYQSGQLERIATRNKVTPITAADLARLLMLAAQTGPLNLKGFEGLFDQHDPEHVERWVSELIKKTLAEPRLSFATIIGVLEASGVEIGEPMSADVIVERLKNSHRLTRVSSIDGHDVLAVFQGISVLVPDLVQVQVNQRFIYFGTSPKKLREAVMRQMEQVPEGYKFGLEELEPQQE